MGKRGPKPGHGGRPTKKIDWAAVEEMCKIQCTEAEIAAILRVDIGTLAGAIRREYNQTFPEYFAEKSAGGKMSLRRVQYEKAMAGDNTMLIWLGKQWLGQVDRSEVATKDITEKKQVCDMRADELDKEIAAIKKQIGKRDA